MRAGPAYAPALAAIHAACFPAGERWDAAAIAAMLEQPGVFALADPAGGLVIARHAGGEAEILTLAVLPALRRDGRGRALLRAALRRCAAAGAGAMFLEVAADNAGALALYAAEGFRAVGRRRAYYPQGGDASGDASGDAGGDALVLRRDLAAGTGAALDEPVRAGHGLPP